MYNCTIDVSLNDESGVSKAVNLTSPKGFEVEDLQEQ
jgi:hypothetical protein